MNTSINRREFLQTSGRVAGGVAALAVGSRMVAAEQAKPVPLSDAFPRYEEFKPLVPVHCVTPKLDGCFHRFFNTSPISPSGRYLAVTRLAREDRLATPDEEAEVVLVDLQTGESRVLAKTKGFDSQLGAQAQWGASDNELFFNDLDTKQWRAFGVRMDPISGERRNLDGPVFEVTRDGKLAASICLVRSAITQRGYGVVIPTEVLPWNEGAAKDDGVYLTDTTTGACRLVVSYKDLLDACGEKLIPTETDRGGGYHGHQLSWNPQGTRLWLALAFNYPQPMTSKKRRLELSLITLKPDGSDVHVAITSPVWRRQGRQSSLLVRRRRAHQHELPNGREQTLQPGADALRRARHGAADAAWSAPGIRRCTPTVATSSRTPTSANCPASKTAPFRCGGSTRPTARSGRWCGSAAGRRIRAHSARCGSIPTRHGTGPTPGWRSMPVRPARGGCTSRRFRERCSRDAGSQRGRGAWRFARRISGKSRIALGAAGI